MCYVGHSEGEGGVYTFITVRYARGGGMGNSYFYLMNNAKSEEGKFLSFFVKQNIFIFHISSHTKCNS